jgi:glycosyltransferase involved in cell wall biosynthesis
MKKIKLSIVSPYPPSMGTLNEYAFHLVKHLSHKNDLESIALISDRCEAKEELKQEASPVPIKIDRSWQFNSLLNPFRILRAARRHKADVVLFNIHFLSFGDRKIAAALGLLTPLLLKLLRIPTVVLLHNLTETVDLNAAGITQNPFLRFCYQQIGTLLTRFLLSADKVAVTISSYVDILESKYKAQNVCLIPHGTFTLAEQPASEPRTGAKKVMAFGKFGTYKKVESMIEAVQKFRKSSQEEVEIVIAGTDSPNRVGYLQEMKAQYQDVPGLTFTGYVPEEEVPRIFRESSVVVFPYESTTGSSGVLHQAGSYGKACILPDIGDLKSLIEEEGYAGEYFAPGDSDSLAQAIHSVLLDDDKRQGLARKNHAASSALPMEDIANWYLLHFQDLLRPQVNSRDLSLLHALEY